jgi:exoribonuclease-2
MPQNFKSHSLVLYKNAPALIEQVADKISIQTAGGKSVKVRPKDIQLLHPGPLKSLGALDQEPQANLDEAWELLQGETVELSELAEFIYGDDSPVSVWHAWLLLQQQTHFVGPADQITARSAEEVEEILSKQREKEQEAARWEEYLQRVNDGRIEPGDFDSLADVQRMAYGKASVNRTLKALGIEAVPEKAHRLLLRLGLWDETVNPYPARFGCATSEPVLDVPALPEDEREDLTALAAFAIDDDNCSDPDDAISLDGDFLWVHIADAAALIQPDSPLDREARARGANLYLPETVINMLPQQVTQTLGLGLQPDRSPALSVKIGLNGDGSASCVKITQSWVKVQRVSYSAADLQMDASPFREMSRITDAFCQHRIAQGAARINLPEVKLKTTVDGELYNLSGDHELGLRAPAGFSVTVSDLPRLKSRDMVTDAMLMAGEALAEFLIKNEIPAPFASQPPPDEPFAPETLSDMFAYRKKFKRSGLHLEPGLHAGLGLERYTRATSPLRRYSDLLVHQQLRAFLRGDPLIGESDMLQRMAEAELGGGNTARAERLSNRHWTLLHMQQNPEKVYRGILVDKRDDRGTVLIPELAIDAKMRRMTDVALDSEVELKLTRIFLEDLDFACRLVS